jgi:hypothetical protein
MMRMVAMSIMDDYAALPGGGLHHSIPITRPAVVTLDCRLTDKGNDAGKAATLTGEAPTIPDRGFYCACSYLGRLVNLQGCLTGMLATWMAYFKALKQNLHVKTFVGSSANALQIQIWTALIALLLLKYLQLRARFG